MVEFLRLLLTKFGINAVPIGGFVFAGWSWATALTIYWIENLVGSLLIALRIALHRRLTHTRGHARAQLGVTTTISGSVSHKEQGFGSFFSEFLVGSLIFTLAHGLFLGLVLIVIVRALPDVEQFRTGALAVLAFLLFDFAIDLIRIKQRPFVWIKRLAQVAFGRIVLVHLAIIFGVMLAAYSERGDVFFLPFAFFKLLADLGSILGRRDASQSTPRWLITLMNRLKPGEDFGAYVAVEQAKERKRAAEDEEVMG
ncbi:hypothetical protein ANRL1_02571 [Anaerolineae bacterium]|nr:hypothetical protein ANRL1_02571 [Anaerolineae bacterium]